MVLSEESRSQEGGVQKEGIYRGKNGAMPHLLIAFGGSVAENNDSGEILNSFLPAPPNIVITITAGHHCEPRVQYCFLSCEKIIVFVCCLAVITALLLKLFQF